LTEYAETAARHCNIPFAAPAISRIPEFAQAEATTFAQAGSDQMRGLAGQFLLQ